MANGSLKVERIDAYRWRIPRQGGMRTEGLIFADEQLIRDLEGDQAVQQLANVAHLPGIVGPAIAMPDIHWGYGFPIGGVAAFDEAEGVVSPGGVGYVAERYDERVADRLGLGAATVTVFIHSGSRGLGYQVCDDHLELMLQAAAKYAITLPDRQLCCAPLGSPEGKRYWGAMNAAANYAFANRQLMAHYARRALGTVFGEDTARRTRLVYDVCHNIAKHETHEVSGARTRLCVHRKGATRAFPPRHPELAPQFRDIGQPVLIPGDMGRYSYVLVGTAGAFTETFGSSCHGAGRRLSRHKAKQLARPRNIPKQPGRAARFTDVGATGQIGSRTDPPHCTSRHHVDVDEARDRPHLSEPESLLPDRRSPEPLFASATSPEFPLGPVLKAWLRHQVPTLPSKPRGINIGAG